jgi:hypothetical protein
LVISKLYSTCHSFPFRLTWVFDSVWFWPIQTTFTQRHGTRLSDQSSWSTHVHCLPTCSASELQISRGRKITSIEKFCQGSHHR